MEITTVHSVDTEYSADSVEWCPHLNYLNFFVCGSYQLEENNSGQVEMESAPCRRKGRIYLFSFDKLTKELNELQRIETSAILDMKWLTQLDQCEPTLATANAVGQIDIYELQNNKLIKCASLHLNMESENLLALSLDWCQRRILVSDSKGGITIMEYTSENKLTMLSTWSAHSYEAWICCFDKWDLNRVYTGGDDTFLHAYDLRSNDRLLLNKSHNAGVTSLLSHPKCEHMLLSGSYDEHLRIFDTRFMKQPQSELNLSGGIWRLKPDPLDQGFILAACMYHNFSVVQSAGDKLPAPTIVGEFNEHKSICYGADWCLNAQPDDEELYMGTCSFYDHKLCIAKARLSQ